MIASRWNWLLLPVGFAIAFEVVTWTYFVPLNRASIIAKNGVPFIPFWEGEVFAFTAFRVLSVVLLSPVCVAFAPRVRRRETFLVGALCGLVSSVLDHFCWNWFSHHIGYRGAFFAIPALSGGVLILLLSYIQSRRGAAALA